MDEGRFDEATLFSTFDSVEDVKQNVITTRPMRKESTSPTELDSLKQENKLLKKVLQKIAPSSCQDNENPVATVVYFDSPASSRSKRVNIEEWMKQVTHETGNHVTDECDLSNGWSSENRSSFWEAFSIAQGKRPGPCEQEDGKLLEHGFPGIPVGSVQYFSLFCLDSFGSTVVDLSPQQHVYEQVYHKVLPNDGSVKSGRQQRTCFNCEGDHKLQDCQKPRDLVKISAKRQEFMEKFSSPFGQEARYHADKAEKFSHLVPGKVSDNLREALGLCGQDAPPFIYRMRMLGYPPGWVPGDQDSGIVLYGKEGKADESDGNHKEKSSNPSQFVLFPGFNVPLPKGIKDISGEVHLPQMNSRHLLPNYRDVVGSSSETDGHKHRPSVDDDNHHDRKRLRTANSETDMDIEMDCDSDVIIVKDIHTPTRCAPSPQLYLESPNRTSTPASMRVNELEDGEIPDSPSFQGTTAASARTVEEMGTAEKCTDGTPTWWLSQPLRSRGGKPDTKFDPPPFPLKPLPLHKISQILPGEMNHVTLKDRLDPVFGNLQVRTGRYDKLRTILAHRASKK